VADEAEFNSALAEISIQWNKAEASIKIAEQVNGEIVNPAIYELRYAGRRLIEAFEAKENGDLSEAIKRLHDAQFDCCRAQHDSIDAVTAKVALDLEAATRKLSPKIVIEFFPAYVDLFKTIQSIRKKIAVSREDRGCRDKVYDSIADVELQALVELHNEFATCEPLMKRQAQFNRGQMVSVAALSALGALAVAVFGFWLQAQFLDGKVPENSPEEATLAQEVLPEKPQPTAD